MAQYIGLPYAPKGRSVEGVDCWGLVKLFYEREFGVEIPSYVEEYLDPTHRQSVSQVILENMGRWAPAPDPLEPGAVLVFSIFGLPLHTGVYIGNGDFLHAFQNTNSCIERMNSITWGRRLLGAYRWNKN